MVASQSKTVLLFDGSCPLCRAEIDIYVNGDSEQALHFLDVMEPNSSLPSSLGREEAKVRFHVVSSDGRLLSGAAAFVEVWKHLPGWRWAAKLASLPGATLALEFVYRAFLRCRPQVVRGFLIAQNIKFRAKL